MKDVFAKLFSVALDAAQPMKILPNVLPPKPKGRTVVVGAGKGAAQLAEAFERLWPHACSGVVVTRHGFDAKTAYIEVLEAAHPVPDKAGIVAAQRLQQAVTGLTADDLVIALICGGGSALLPAPSAGITLEDEIILTQNLLRSGLPIAEMNSIRALFSTIKAGRLAVTAAPAQVIGLIVSDVAGDRLDLIASAPTIPANDHVQVALRVLQQGKVALPVAMQNFVNNAAWNLPNTTDKVFANNRHHLIASAGQSLTAAAEYAQGQGYDVTVLSDCLEGEAATVARTHGAMIRATNTRCKQLVLSGGELTVTHSADTECSGKGGPNSEYLLALAEEIAGMSGVYIFAADSDGIDGYGDHAGAFADGESTVRMQAAGIDAKQCLAQHNSYAAFEAIGDLFITGATGTNVNDIRGWIIQ